MDRKEFAKRKKLMEEKVKLKLIEKYPHINELFQSGEITLKQAYDGAQSEMLGIETFKSRGTKTFISHSTKIEKEEQTSTQTLPFGRNPIGDNPKYNITYDEVNKMGYGEFKDFILSVRKKLLNLWEEQNIPPYIGKDKKGIVDDIKNLIQFDVERLWKKGDDIYEYILSNDFHHGSSCNQFQPSLHKTRAGDVSMWDVIKEPSLELKFIRTFTRNLKQDKMYMVSKMMKEKNDYKVLDREKYCLIILPVKQKDKISFNQTEIKNLFKEGVIEDYHIKNIGRELETETHFHLRYFRKDEQVMKHIIHTLRVGFSNIPINFSPLVSRYLYEKYLPQSGGLVYDPCSGWGGRLMGSICSSKNIQYIGCDVNSNIFQTNSYERIGEFIQEEIGRKSKYKVHQISSTRFNETDDFKEYKGKVDLILTSPPYFNQEQYSTDKEQSYNLYPSYEDWINGYIRKTFQIGYDLLKQNGVLLLNIADTKKLHLELDTLGVLEEIGFEFQYEIGMKMKRYLGLDTQKIYNRYYDEDRIKYVKVEPIMKFLKK
ncbi:site-specific DNA-methyltransferase [Flavobacteriaceae bacterium]|nr:site-specific DNA-methyltransferase [Flavobacteriaceae bacterium]